VAVNDESRRIAKWVSVQRTPICWTGKDLTHIFELALQNGEALTTARRIAAHESPRTTALYERTQEEVDLDEIERIRI
jgi:hypothetical protein